MREYMFFRGEWKVKNYIKGALLLGLIGSATAISVTQPVNFDNDTLGAYDKYEFLADWGIYPGSSSGQKNDQGCPI
jgi:hypothetical protein